MTSLHPTSLLDLPNELFLVIFSELDLESLFMVAMLCRRMNFLAIKTIFTRNHQQEGASSCLVVDPPTIQNGITRATRMELPRLGKGVVDVLCHLDRSKSLVLRETTRILESAASVSHFRLMAFSLIAAYLEPSAEDWFNLLSSISKHSCTVFSFLTLEAVPPLGINYSTSLIPMRHLREVTLDTPLLKNSGCVQWFIKSLNASPVRMLRLYSHHDIELLQQLSLSRLREFFISCRGVTLLKLDKFLSRHCHITSLNIDTIKDDSPPLPLSPELLGNLTRLSIPPIYVAFMLPNPNLTSPSLQLRLAATIEPWVQYSSQLDDALAHIANSHIHDVELSLIQHDIPSIDAWIEHHFNADSTLSLPNVTSLTMHCSKFQASTRLPDCMLHRFPRIKLCVIKSEPLNEDARLSFARRLARVCPLLDSVYFKFFNAEWRYTIDREDVELVNEKNVQRFPDV